MGSPLGDPHVNLERPTTASDASPQFAASQPRAAPRASSSSSESGHRAPDLLGFSLSGANPAPARQSRSS
eukprot:4493821-Heterocapsa_arctica.AAC.1